MAAAALRLRSEHACFGGVQGFYAHDSVACNAEMRFAVYRPPQASAGPGGAQASASAGGAGRAFGTSMAMSAAGQLGNQSFALAFAASIRSMLEPETDRLARRIAETRQRREAFSPAEPIETQGPTYSFKRRIT